MVRIPAPAPGIHENVPFDVYRSWDAVNNSLLTQLRRSPAHAKASIDGLLPDEQSPSLRLGSLIHTGVLEPGELESRYAVMPQFELDPQNRTKDGRQTTSKATGYYKDCVDEWLASTGAAGRQIVSQDEFDTMRGVIRSIAAHSGASELLATPGLAECAIVWDDEAGVRCKSRLDKLAIGARRIVVDLKTTRDAATFERSVWAYGYHRQGAFYLRGSGAENFVIVAVETSPPYGVRVAPMSQRALDAGRKEIDELLATFAACQRSGEWPGYDDPLSWDLPDWAAPENQQSIGDWLAEVNASA